ncbi:MAG TPA: hypothetical protein VH418_21050 [Solirubrobacteraceae bacterium]
MSAAGLEAARELAAPGDTDAVTFAWADATEELYGIARLGRGAAADGSPQGSALAILFAGRSPVGVLVRGGEALPDAGWERLALPGLETAVDVPLERWTVSGEGGATFRLSFEAAGPPDELGAPAARAAGLTAYAQLCRVHGSVRVAGRERPVNGVGQRSHGWGNPDWDGIELTRSLGIWFADGTGVLAGAVRPAGAQSHAEETTCASLVGRGGSLAVAEARLSTTTDGGGRQRRAGLELWLDEEQSPHRAAGELLCGSTLDLGALRLDCAFLRWHMEGREGVGRYEVLRRA